MDRPILSKLMLSGLGKKPWREKGFTLLELLLAMGMLAVVLVTVGTLLSGHFFRLREENVQWENLAETRSAVEQIVRRWQQSTAWQQNPAIDWNQATGELYADGVLIGRNIADFKKESFVGRVVLADGRSIDLTIEQKTEQGTFLLPGLTAFSITAGEEPESECSVFLVLRNSL